MSGDTTSGGVSRISKALEVSSPDFVLIELGGNDALRGYPLENIEKNLEITTGIFWMKKIHAYFLGQGILRPIIFQAIEITAQIMTFLNFHHKIIKMEWSE